MPSPLLSPPAPPRHVSSFDLDSEDQHFTPLTYFSDPFDADFAEADECRAEQSIFIAFRTRKLEANLVGSAL